MKRKQLPYGDLRHIELVSTKINHKPVTFKKKAFYGAITFITDYSNQSEM